VSIPEELQWVQQLIQRRGPSGTLRMIGATCADTADRTHDSQVAQQWRECARIIEDSVALVRRVEPPSIEEEGGA
jgi:hypothetical protein